jgi:ABC-2 type transport system ATP-binding protein
MNAAVEVERLTKRFGATLALDQVSFAIPPGKVLALLGPNGAGKTTLIRILTTLLRPDGGHARVAGLDVQEEATAIRSLIGLAGQFATVDELLTGRENLELVGLLYHLERGEYRRRAQVALERMSLTSAANAPVKTYSGGMRRRLDVAASLIGQPPVLFLDEPTTGLDPRTRNDLWAFIGQLVADGTTVLLTTQYMEEAEHLADDIIVLDVGHIVAQGTADELKDRLGGDVLEIRVRDAHDFERAAALVGGLSDAPMHLDPDLQQLSLPVKDGAQVLLAAGRLLDDHGIGLADVGVRRPSLDDVFLAFTGHGVESGDETDASTRVSS